jgi:hypothetical protein
MAGVSLSLMKLSTTEGVTPKPIMAFNPVNEFFFTNSRLEYFSFIILSIFIL